MIGVDTNVLLRGMLEPATFPRAEAQQTQLAMAALAAANELYLVNVVVLIETVWVLRRGFQRPKPEVLDFVERLLGAANIQVERAELVGTALAAARNGPADFADYLIGYVNRAAGCAKTLTFDRGAGRAADLFTQLD
jgi:predicted nucleic-acid-binding protein